MLPVHRGRLVRLAVKSILGAASLSMLASAAQAQETKSATQLEEVVVTGFRSSLEAAIETKKNATSIVDVINAEDIADFPDLNLAESLQRVPGVSIDRDGGEGRTIVVRGLGADFTRVRLNGLEALATTGGKDPSGGANRGRSFDFNVFASELFSSLTVRKSQTADVEEGSLGATIDLQTSRPFDYKDFTLAFGAQAAYNDLSEKTTPRATFLIADTWFDRRLGALFSVAYANRNTLEEGSSTGRWESPAVTGNSAGNFQAPFPADVGAAWHPRIPRYGRLTYDQDRLGMTASIQANPWDATHFTFDALYAKLDGSRKEEYLEIISFSRASAGNPQTDVVSGVVDGSNNLIAGTFNDVDARTEQRIDELSTEFTQFSLSFQQDLGASTKLNAVVGTSKSVQDNPVQTTISLDRYDTDGYAYDFRANQRLPEFNYGFDATNPSAWSFSPTSTLGDASLIRMRPNTATNTFDTISVDMTHEFNSVFQLKGGALYKEYELVTVEKRRYVIGGITEGAVPLPPGVTVADISQLVTGYGSGMNLPAGTPTSWRVPNLDAVSSILGINCDCINQYGDFRLSINNQLAGNRQITEQDAGVFVQADFNTELFSMPFRGNVGVRYVETKLSSSGYVGTTPTTVDNDYSDVLPAVNLVLEPAENLLVRAGFAKVLSRPQLPFLTPGGTISNGARTLTIGNPLLDPMRANAVDLSIEWYPEKETLVSLGLFYKDIQSYIQRTQTSMPYSETGLPLSLLNSGNTADTVFNVTQQTNTEGGDLKGFEVSLQKPFTFLPAPFDGFGGIVNYTYVQSDIEYIVTASSNPANVRTTVEPLVSLSPVSWNATLYFENKRFSARVSTAYRDEYLTRVPGDSGADVAGKFETLNVDASASVKITEALTLTAEGINLTDEFDSRWHSRARQNLESYEHSGRQYFVGFRMTF